MDSNGYKDAGQNIVQFAIEELGLSFGDIAKPGAAVTAVKGWSNAYKKAKASGVGTGIAGACGLVTLLAMSVPVASVAAVSCGACSLLGFGAAYVHGRGQKNNETELELLRLNPAILGALQHAVQNGAPGDVAVSTYSQILARHSTGRSISAELFKSILAESTNASIAAWKTSQSSADAFDTGIEMLQELKDDYGDDDEYDDEEDVEFTKAPVDPQAHLPAFLRSADPSKKADGTALQVVPFPAAKGAPVSVVDDMTNPLRSSYIAAPPRTGKGILCSMGLTEVKRRYPNSTIYSYTPKQDEKEHWYWKASDAHYNPDLDENPAKAAQGLYQMIREWQALPSSADAPILFVLDELSITLARMKTRMSEVDPHLFKDDRRAMSEWLMDFAVHEASMRQSVDRFVWAMTPLNTVGETGVSKGAIGALKNYTLAGKTNLKFADGGAAAFSAPKVTENHPLFQNHLTIAYGHDAQKWLPVPKLEQKEIEKMAKAHVGLKRWGEIIDTDRLMPWMDAIAMQAVTAAGMTARTENVGTINSDGRMERPIATPSAEDISEVIDALSVVYAAMGEAELTRAFGAAAAASVDGGSRASIKSLVQKPFAKSKTDFCAKVGKPSGEGFNRFGAVYDWGMAL